MRKMKLRIKRLLPRRYYVNVLRTIGTMEVCVAGQLFCTKAEALAHAESLRYNRTYRYVGTLTVWSWRRF